MFPPPYRLPVWKSVIGVWNSVIGVWMSVSAVRDEAVWAVQAGPPDGCASAAGGACFGICTCKHAPTSAVRPVALVARLGGAGAAVQSRGGHAGHVPGAQHSACLVPVPDKDSAGLHAALLR